MLRFTRKPIAWMVGGALVALPAPALPAGETGQDIPITDPVMLASLGFEPDATNVYATPQAFKDLLMAPQQRAAVQEARLEEHRAAQEGSPGAAPFGTDTAEYAAVPAQAFRPLTSETAYSLTLGAQGDELTCFVGFPFFDGTFYDLPHGARLARVDFWMHDANDEGMGAFLFRTCQPDFAAGTTSSTVLASVSTPEAGGGGDRFHSVLDLDEDIDLQSCVYFARVRLDGGTSECFDFDETGGLRIQKVRAQWRRQVSPPPASPTFGDVDPDHPFFAHIEALAASGITGGCGDGSDFCPDASLTRGQMAVFLAKALGLHWGEITQ